MNENPLVIEILLVLVLLFQGAGFLAYFLNRALIAEARAFYHHDRETQRLIQIALTNLTTELDDFRIEGSSGGRTAIEESRQLLTTVHRLLLEMRDLK